MKQEHKYAQVLRWIADGETIEVKRNRGEWVALPGESANCILRNIADGNCVSISEFRLKPRTITVNGREIVAGESEAPTYGVWYWHVAVTIHEMAAEAKWTDVDFDMRALDRGLVHLTKENAIAHAKAMLGIE